MYIVFPNISVKWHAALIGACVAGTLFQIARIGFSRYFALVWQNYSEVYGTLAMVIILAIWIYATWVVILLGAEVTTLVQYFNSHGGLQRRPFDENKDYINPSYNHRREGPNALPADAEGNPEVNIGTGNMNLQKWGPLVEHFITDLQNFDFLGRHLDVRQNVKFRGGHFSRWIHEFFPDSGCALAIEFKKFFMDEWTGEPDMAQINTIQQALQSTLPRILKELGTLNELP